MHVTRVDVIEISTFGEKSVHAHQKTPYRSSILILLLRGMLPRRRAARKHSSISSGAFKPKAESRQPFLPASYKHPHRRRTRRQARTVNRLTASTNRAEPLGEVSIPPGITYSSLSLKDHEYRLGYSKGWDEFGFEYTAHMRSWRLSERRHADPGYSKRSYLPLMTSNLDTSGLSAQLPVLAYEFKHTLYELTQDLTEPHFDQTSSVPHQPCFAWKLSVATVIPSGSLTISYSYGRY
ncbi:mitochondrial division protein 1 [Striga asiatica]|uniref:Mitochondrial division protein 1 n=1 Tax=Striga asiatica TaxID=4170 RepID=A0A5A7Q2P2_STRAF|nr:mitochondrial division protein 1 [Striga asiatica]